MKKNIKIILAIVILCCAYAHGQDLKVNTVIKARHSSFTIKQQKGNDGLNVYNNANVNQNDYPKLRIELWVNKPDKHSVLNIFRQVFSPERLQQLPTEPKISINYFVSANTGKVLEVSFSLKKNTMVTADELEALENLLKSNIVFQFHKEDVQSSQFIRLTESVPFRRVLDGSLPEDFN